MARTRIIWLPGLFLLEIAAIIAVFQMLSAIECRLTEMESACRGLRGSVISVLCLFGGFGIFLWARRSAWTSLVSRVRDNAGGAYWVGFHALGILLIFMPLMVIPPASANQNFAMIFAAMISGGTVAGIGGLFWLLPPREWRVWLANEKYLPMYVALLALLIPVLSNLMQPLWSVNLLSSATFHGVALFLSATSADVLVDPSRALIGLPGFIVEVASACSGIEGFALITGFMVIYSILVRDTLHQKRFWLLLWPMALLFSWVFNLLRITTLILIGKHVSPVLAVDGFHSFAGWLLFTLLGLMVLGVAQSLPWLHKDSSQRQAGSRLSDDAVAAMIVPFIIFMISGVVVQAFWVDPILGYPVQTFAMVAALLWMRRPLVKQIVLTWDPIPIASGLVIGALWVVFSDTDSSADHALATLSQGALLVWILCRVLGTTVLVPIIEEAFFRGYLLTRFDNGTRIMQVGTVAGSTLLFALLHGRIILAGIAGLIFAAILLRRGRLGDAVVAHMVANGAIAAVALATGRWSLI